MAAPDAGFRQLKPRAIDITIGRFWIRLNTHDLGYTLILSINYFDTLLLYNFFKHVVVDCIAKCSNFS